MRRYVTTAASLMAITLVMGVFSLCFAQSSVGAINGTVTDTTGAVVSGASVEVTNVGTNEKRTTTTNNNGNYSVPNLEAGLYSVAVSAPTFSSASVKDVKVSVSFVTSLNLELKPGATAEVVEVTGADAQVQINTTDQQLSTLIDNRKILELPLLSRDPNALILLSPGVVQSSSGLGGFVVNGSRERNNNFLVDGTDNNDTEVPGIPGGVTTPNIDATQEFRVITNNFNAEFGRNSGAIINVATKSGTNEYHGGLYYYNRNDTFSARDFFDVTGDSSPLHRNQFGGTIGGPVLKDKLFFFANYEGDRFNVGSDEVRAVPSALARIGILPVTPFGPLDLRSSSRNNRFRFPIQQGVVNLLNSIYPLGNPNDPAVLFPGTFDVFRFKNTFKQRSDETTSRVDYQLGSKNRLFARYGYSRGDFDFSAPTFPDLNDGIASLQKTQLFAMGFTTLITPNLINEVRFGFNRLNLPFNGPGSGDVPTTLDDKIRAAFQSSGIPVQNLGFGGPNGRGLNLIISGIESLGGFDTQTRFTGTTTVADTITYVRGAHTFKGGFELRQVYSNSDTNFGRRETLTFDPATFGLPIVVDNNGTRLPVSGLGATFNNYAAFLYGLVGQQFQTQFFDKSGARTDSNFRGFRVREVDTFFQDTWRIKPNFSLNYGIRYEFKGVPYEVNGLISTLVNQDPGDFRPAGGFVFQLVGKNSGRSEASERLNLYDDDYNNFAPRFGFAWDPFKDGKTSIRGGYGVFYDRVFGNLFTNARDNLPFEFGLTRLPLFEDDLLLLDTLPRLPSTVTRFNSNVDDFLIPVIFPLKGRDGKANNPFQREFRTPYSQNFNFGIQRELLRGLVLEVDYVGTKGTKLLTNLDGNRTSVRRKNLITGANNPISASSFTNYLNGSLHTDFNVTFVNTSTAFSTYHAVTVRITKSLTSEKYGLGQIQGVYTFGHSIDNGEDPLAPQDGAGGRTLPRDSSGFEGGYNRPERGDSGFDVRNRFVGNFVYEFPFKSNNKVLDAVISSFSMGGIIQVNDGQPFSILATVDSMGTGRSGRASFANPAAGLPGIPVSSRLNPRLQTGPTSNNFRNPRLGERGDVPRSAFVGPGFAKVDFQVTKRFTVAERHTFSIRADFFNLFNRVNLLKPVNSVTSPVFGQSLSAFDSRIIQFVARYNF